MNHKKLLAFVLSAALTLGTAGAIMAPDAQAAKNGDPNKNYYYVESNTQSSGINYLFGDEVFIVENETYTLTEDMRFTSRMYGGKTLYIKGNVTIDLNGYEMKFYGDSLKFADNKSTVTFKNVIGEQHAYGFDNLTAPGIDYFTTGIRASAVKFEQAIEGVSGIITLTEKTVYTDSNPLYISDDTFIDARTAGVPVIFDGDNSLVFLDRNAKLDIYVGTDSCPLIWSNVRSAEYWREVYMTSNLKQATSKNVKLVFNQKGSEIWKALQGKNLDMSVDLIVAEDAVYTNSNPLVITKDTIIETKTNGAVVNFDGNRSLRVENGAHLYLVSTPEGKEYNGKGNLGFSHMYGRSGEEIGCEKVREQGGFIFDYDLWNNYVLELPEDGLSFIDCVEHARQLLKGDNNFSVFISPSERPY